MKSRFAMGAMAALALFLGLGPGASADMLLQEFRFVGLRGYADCEGCEPSGVATIFFSVGDFTQSLEEMQPDLGLNLYMFTDGATGVFEIRPEDDIGFSDFADRFLNPHEGDLFNRHIEEFGDSRAASANSRPIDAFASGTEMTRLEFEVHSLSITIGERAIFGTPHPWTEVEHDLTVRIYGNTIPAPPVGASVLLVAPVVLRRRR